MPDVAQATEQALASINAVFVHLFPWYWYMTNVLRGPSELQCKCGNLKFVFDGNLSLKNFCFEKDLQLCT
jgi:hypothetical protein